MTIAEITINNTPPTIPTNHYTISNSKWTNMTITLETHTDAYILQTYLQQYGQYPIETYKLHNPDLRPDTTLTPTLNYYSDKYNIWQNLYQVDRFIFGCKTEKTAKIVQHIIETDNPTNRVEIYTPEQRTPDYLGE